MTLGCFPIGSQSHIEFDASWGKPLGETRQMDNLNLMISANNLVMTLASSVELEARQHLPESSNENEKYRLKLKKLRKAMRSMIFENAALCDEVAKTQEKTIRAKEERRFLLKKLMHLQAMNEVSNQMLSRLTGSAGMGSACPGPSMPMLTTASATANGVTTPGLRLSISKVSDCGVKSKRKVGMMKRSSRELLAVIGTNRSSSSKRRRTSSIAKRLVQPIPLDSTGRPIFPIVLGGLTVHSLGEIVPDRPGFHCEDHIFPVGFCSSRIYASMKNPEQKCLYTCKISDGGTGPKFEISAEDDSDHPIVGTSATDCHSNLLKAVNAARNLMEHRNLNVVDITGRGAKFFGFSHPTIQNLIQSCLGARKCSSYKWVKFEVSKPDQANDVAYCMSDNDATISFEALQRKFCSLTPGTAENMSTAVNMLGQSITF